MSTLTARARGGSDDGDGATVAHAHEPFILAPITNINIAPANTANQNAAAYTHMKPLTPFLEITGVRPILSLLAFTSALIQMYLAITSLYDLGCILVGIYVLSCGILSIILLVALHLMPLLIGRTHLLLVLLRRFCWLLLVLLLPGFGIFNVLAAIWIHQHNCWDRVYMRNLAVGDIIITYCIIIGTIWYLWSNILQHTRWWTNQVRIHGKVDRIAQFIKKYARHIILAICLVFMLGGLYHLYSYNQVLVNSYHWSFSDRPAPCEKSCKERWRPNKRMRKCMNGHNHIIPIQYCLDYLAPLEMLPSNHLMLQQCPTITCVDPQGQRLRYHWSMRSEHEVRAGECTKHDRRMIEQVGLVQEFGCFDEHQRVWVDEGWCAALEPPFSSSGRPESFRLLYWKDKHCLHRCQPAWGLTWWFVLLQACGVASSLMTLLGPRWQMRQIGIKDPSKEEGQSGPLSLPTRVAGSLHPAAPDLTYVRHHLHTLNDDSWILVRFARTIFYVHVYGMDVLTFPWRLATRTLIVIVTLMTFLLGVKNMIWLSDTHCYFFNMIAIPNAILASFAFVTLVCTIIRQLQEQQQQHVTDQPTMNHTNRSSMYTKEEEYEDR